MRVSNETSQIWSSLALRTKEFANQRSISMEAGAKMKLMGKVTKSKEIGKRSLDAILSHSSVNVTTNTYETKKDVKTRSSSSECEVIN